MNSWNKPLAKRVYTMMLAVLVMMAGLPTLSVQAAEEVANARFIVESYQSVSMDKEMTYRIYLPEGYADNEQRYPVVYLLHQEDSSSQQFADAAVDKKLDEWMAQGLMQKMIVVMPDTSGDSWFVNRTDAPWEDMLVSDLISHVDDTYRTIPLAKFRGISGVSMGGYGAFVLGLKHPELFSSIGSHMGALDRKVEGLQPLETIKAMSAADQKAYKYYLDGGTEDPSTYADGSTNDIHAYFRGAKVAHEYQMRPGGHTADYYLNYLDRSFMMHSNNFGSSLVKGSFTAAPQAINVGQQTVKVDFTVNLDRASAANYVLNQTTSSNFHLNTLVQVTDVSGVALYSDSVDLGDVITGSAQGSFTGSFTIPVTALGQDKSYNVTLSARLLGMTYALGSKPLIQVTPMGSAAEDVQIDLLGDWFFTKDTFPSSTVNGLTPNLQNGDWRTVQPGLDWWTDGFGGYSGLNNYYGAAWYYREFTVPADFPDQDLTLLAGKIDDADQTYINGQLVGKTGFNDNGEYTSSFWAASRSYSVPSGLLKRGETNTISVRLYNQNGGGGWYSGPIGIYTKAALQKVNKLPSKVPSESVVADVKALAVKQLNAISSQEMQAYRNTLSAGYFEKGYDKLQRIDQMAGLVKGYTDVKAQVEGAYVFELDGKYLYTANVTLTGKNVQDETVTIKQSVVSQYYKYENGAVKETGDQKLFYVTEFFSESANRMVKYRVYLPPSYLEQPSKRYPSVYLLHQFNSDSESFEIDKIDQILDKGIQQGSIKDMIVVIPDSSGTSFWVNGAGANGVKWQDMVTKDLVPLVDTQYRTIDDARYRGTSGVSMGGFGAFVIGFQYPDQFSSVASHMGALSMTNTGQFPVKIVTDYPVEALKSYSIYFDSGNLDVYSFDLPVNTLHKYLMNAGVPHYAEVRDGAHDSAFYTKSIDLSFAQHSTHFRSANVGNDVLSGKVKVEAVGETTELTYELLSTEALAVYANDIPTSVYVKDQHPVLKLPVTVDFYNKTSGEKLYSYQTEESTKGAQGFTGTFIVPQAMTAGTYEAVLTSAVLDRSFELSRMTYTVSSGDGGPVTENPSNGGVVTPPANESNVGVVGIADIQKALAAQTGLELKAGDNSKLEIPYETLKQLSESVGLEQLKELAWKVDQLSQADQSAWLKQAKSQWNGQWASAGKLVDFQLTAVMKNGTARPLNVPFTKAVRVSLKADANADYELTGLYHLTSDNKLAFIGGTYDAASGMIQADLEHFSAYGVLAFTKVFKDVQDNHWAHRAIEVLSAQHVVVGTSDEQYSPNRQITRAEFAALLVRSLGLDENGTELPFKDVSSDSWYYAPVAAAFHSGLVRGMSEQSFAPHNTITREEMAVMLYRAYQWKTKHEPSQTDKLGSFSDESQIHSWARQALNEVVELGLIKGTSDTTLAPLSQATRAEAAQMVYNLTQALR
ncbi:alpha/beta hydrolase-fold protein [Paenibacillus luteus]|uniref:alpha/beta hydrolase-fold protein n=1 Tax=Paenibacillus luteus TaxID=2545753 RepID=UPI0011439D3A|nr:alpha/beta hydrolase-fold protein [Paenibacillus luteus]